MLSLGIGIGPAHRGWPLALPTINTPGIALVGDSLTQYGHAYVSGTGFTASRDTNGLITLTKTNHGIYGDQRIYLANWSDNTFETIGDGHFVDANNYTVQTSVTGLPASATPGANAAIVQQGMFTLRGIWPHLQSAFNGGLNFQGNFGQGGDLASQMSDAVIKATAAASDFVVICAGINDIKSGVPAATTAASVKARIDEIIAGGRKAIVISITPIGSQFSGYATYNAASQAANAIVQAHCDGSTKFWIDGFTPLYDGVSAAYPWATIGDGVHWTDLAAHTIATQIASVMAPHMTGNVLLPVNSSQASLVPWATLVRNRGPWALTTGGNFAAGASGSLPPGWTGGRASGSATAVYSIVDPGDGKGYKVSAQITAAAANDEVYTWAETNNGQTLATLGFSVGDSFIVGMEVDWSGWNAANAKRMLLEVVPQTSGPYQDANVGTDSSVTQTQAQWLGDSGSLILVTGVNKISASTTSLIPRLRVNFTAAGAALTLNVRRVCWFKV